MRIDSHHHFWKYSPEEYSWINDAMRVIRRDFGPEQLAKVTRDAGIDGVVSVQARQSVGETDWLLGLAEENPQLVRGVVGWLPLREKGAGIAGLLESYRARPLLKGLRHVLQDEADEYFVEDAFHAALAQLPKHGLTYDLLLTARQIPAACRLVDRQPNLLTVVDHIAKPVVQGAPPKEWVMQMREIARRPQVCCKFSGVVTEVPGWKWTPELLKPYFEVALEAFGADRLMFGSDWPVCEVATEYTRWVRFVDSCVAPLSVHERAAIMGGNAARFYRLSAK